MPKLSSIITTVTLTSALAGPALADSAATTAQAQMRARITELCKDPAVIAKLEQPDEVCQVSPDGGKTWIWIPVGLAALIGAGCLIRRRIQSEQEDMLTPGLSEDTTSGDPGSSGPTSGTDNGGENMDTESTLSESSQDSFSLNSRDIALYLRKPSISSISHTKSGEYLGKPAIVQRVFELDTGEKIVLNRSIDSQSTIILQIPGKSDYFFDSTDDLFGKLNELQTEKSSQTTNSTQNGGAGQTQNDTNTLLQSLLGSSNK